MGNDSKQDENMNEDLTTTSSKVMDVANTGTDDGLGTALNMNSTNGELQSDVEEAASKKEMAVPSATTGTALNMKDINGELQSDVEDDMEMNSSIITTNSQEY